MRLTALRAGVVADYVAGIRPRQPFNPNEEPMGSTSFGNVTPAMTGPAMPQNIRINRAGLACVRVMVAPS